MVSVLLFIGACGKSAQLFLHTWLPDAMEGPTPVSALIHAATMVTAGVFLVCRMSPIFEWAPAALTFVTVIGAATAFFAATVGLVQNDIKRVIAYSTCSQLGYMFVAAGVGAYPAAMFHLFTHAFFKALLFLGAGSVIHAMHHEQDMRHYGGLRSKIPLTFWAMVIGTVAITGVGIPLTNIGFAGFLSKDAIIESAYAGHNPAAGFAFWLLVISALMTSFYSWRLIFLTFFGAPRGDHHTHDHAHESPRSMLIPLGGARARLGPRRHDLVRRLLRPPLRANGSARRVFFGPENETIHLAHEAPAWVKASPFFAMLIGLGIAYWFYIVDPSLPVAAREPAARPLPVPAQQVVLRRALRRHLRAPGHVARPLLWKQGDGATIDGAINGVAMGIVPAFTRLAGRVQSGYVFHYAFAMVIGLVVLMLWLAITAGGN